MGLVYLGLPGVSWKLMIKSWWDKLVAGFLLASVVLGSLYVAYRISRKIKKYWGGRHRQVVLPAPIARFFEDLQSESAGAVLMLGKIPKQDLKSFGVFLGAFNAAPTAAERRILSLWDVLVLDPFQEGVLDALETCPPSAMHILGRLDMQALTQKPSSHSNDEVIQSLMTVIEAVVNKLKKDGKKSQFTGILLANFQTHFQPVVFNNLAELIRTSGYDVWVEMSPPAYLTERESREINMKNVTGLVCRNGTIQRGGDRQNYFQMSEMRQTMRVVAAQKVAHGPPMMMWETVEGEADLNHAVVSRSFNWCTFNNALPWIGPNASLNDAEVAASKSVLDKPLGALMWLKGDDIMESHEVWRLNTRISHAPCDHNALYDTLQAFVPNLATKLRLLPADTERHAEKQLSIFDGLGLGSRKRTGDFAQPNPLSTSESGKDLTGLGCFQIGLEINAKDFGEVLHAQKNLKDLKLLQSVQEDELESIRAKIAPLKDVKVSASISSTASRAIEDLLALLCTTDHEGSPRLRVYVGLHSGFQLSSKIQVWGVYDHTDSSNAFTIYLSGKTKDRAGALLHTFLSSRGCSRMECFMAEIAMAEKDNSLSQTWQLPLRFVQDLEQLSPAETLLLVGRSTLPCDGGDGVLSKIRACCEHQLMDIPTLTQLRTLGSSVYLGGEITSEALVAARIAWCQQQGSCYPVYSNAVALFEEVEARLRDVLLTGESDVLAQLGVVIQAILKAPQIDAAADIFALSVFCAIRKMALDELYLEVLDRNPYPNHTTDQAGCFAESFALGSRCESFFDMTPKHVGRLVSERYRDYYHKNQPPRREEGFTELPTAYAATQADVDPEEGKEEVAALYQITFLGIFAVPALIDITLLTTIGRGLYLTTFMSDINKTMATTALMLALLACGAVGSWITSGGSYYLFANGFPAMNMFVLTRFVAGLVIVILGGIGGFVATSVYNGILPGLVFLFYFAMLSTYLMTLAALSIYQVPGSSFQSGRNVIMKRVPILFISPVLTIFVQHDIAVYPCVLTCFLVSLLLGARSTMAEWSTWYLRIPDVTDAQILKWYVEIERARNPAFSAKEEMVLGAEPRKAFHAAVLKEHERPFWRRRTKDPLIAKLADGYASTKFLMSWYCKFKRNKMSLPYSTTWNLTLKAALENMTNMQKGLKLHSAFLHWRHTGSDIWSGLLYFVVALLDKWAALVSGTALVGLSAASSKEFRLSVGFGLCYYLIGAVALDTVSQPLWMAATAPTFEPISSLESLRQATNKDIQVRRALYWSSLAKFFFLHIWGIVITAALMWLFESSRDATILYLAYIGAYTGLLWYQYNKIYCGTRSAECLAVATIIGLPIGIALHVYLPTYAFSGVIALACGTWVAAIHSIFLSGIGLPVFFSRSTKTSDESKEKDANISSESPVYSCGSLAPYVELSQSTLSKSFRSLHILSNDARYRLDPSQHPGARVMELLRSNNFSRQSRGVKNAFSDAEDLLQRTAQHWATGKTVVELVSSQHFPHPTESIRTISRKLGDQLHVFIVIRSRMPANASSLDFHRNCNAIAEAVVQASAEAHFGLSHDHAMLAALLVVQDMENQNVGLPESAHQHLESSTSERTRVISNTGTTFLRYLLLGVEVDTEWIHLPEATRKFLLQRCYGRSIPFSDEEKTWIRSRISTTDSIEPEEYLARCELGAGLTTAITASAKILEETCGPDKEDPAFPTATYEKLLTSGHESGNVDSSPKRTPVKSFIFESVHKLRICLKFLILSLTADPEYQRELDYMLHSKPLFIHWPLTFFLNGVWSLCKMLQDLVLPLALFHGRENVSKLYRNMKEMKTVQEKHRIVIESLSGTSTCFAATQPDGSSRLSQYSGCHTSEPSDRKQLMAVNTYTNKLVLRQREEYKSEEMTNLFTYEYPQNQKRSASKFPLQRQCLRGKVNGEIVHYDDRGYINSGSTFRGVNPVDFTYWYRKNAQFDDELLRGEYVFPHITIRVSWSVPSLNHPKRLDEWVPFSKVTEATFIQGSDVHHASWTYEHKFHPEISTTLNGKPVETPAMIEEDWFHVLEKPTKCDFLSNNPLLSFSSIKSGFLSRRLGLNVRRYPVPTSHARTQLWKTWKGGKELDAITARWLDERAVRSDSVLRPYWRSRDMGLLDAAKHYLDSQADTIMARVDIHPETSSWVHIAFKISDFYSMGQGGDSRINTRTLQGQIRDRHDELHVLAMDTSTWPNEPGGVSACRRDMVNELKTIKWHIVAESANDYGIPRFQIERNVQSLTVLPLWGLDFLNPTHGVLENSLDSAVVLRSHNTTTRDIEENFLPILTSLVKCSRTQNLRLHHLEEATAALVDLNTYFEGSRNWNDVWNSNIVKQTWRELWLTEDMEDILPVSQWWDFERPSMHQMDQALNMWHRYLFIFSIQIPEEIPEVFQASHHFTGATYGILCKVKRQCTLHVWDHCISFRELTMFMSSAVSFDTPFINSSLISLGHLSCVLLEHHADVVLPCAAYFNPSWEVELGSAEGAIEHRNTFARKIDPVVNGICNMEKFEPIKTVKTSKPTVVMLSHVQYVKDIKNAIMATDIIVNKWGFKDYSLHVYGDMERAAAISTECQELIASKGLREHCILKGLGNPSVVLQDAWLFLNSSISEGLPLAMGEAALTGVPVVCTDVGASFCVVTDGTTGDRFSEVVSPNDSESLARAQINVMGLLGRWAAYGEDEPGTSAPILAYPTPSAEQVRQITARIYAKTEQRRKLGMLGRTNVLKNFSSERYLREHEQMLWIGKYRAPRYRMRRSKMKATSCATSSAASLQEKPLFIHPLKGPRLTPESWTELSRTSGDSRPTSTDGLWSWVKDKTKTSKHTRTWTPESLVSTAVEEGLRMRRRSSVYVVVNTVSSEDLTTSNNHSTEVLPAYTEEAKSK